MKKKYFTLVAVAILAITFAVNAEAMGDDKCEKMQDKGDDITSMALNLTDAQKEEARNLQKRHLKDVYSLEDKLTEQKRALKGLWLEKTPDEDKIFALKKEMMNTKNKLTQNKLDYQLSVIKLLTPEQKEKLKSLKDSMGGGMMMDKAPRGRAEGKEKDQEKDQAHQH